jgi:hypothetical protein
MNLLRMTRRSYILRSIEGDAVGSSSPRTRATGDPVVLLVILVTAAANASRTAFCGCEWSWSAIGIFQGRIACATARVCCLSCKTDMGNDMEVKKN